MTDLFGTPLSPDLEALWQRIRSAVDGNAPPDIAGLPETQRTFAQSYLPIAVPERAPFVVGQLGQSLDGYIATKAGASHYVTGMESRVHLHRLRALCDTVVVGWRTVAADDPKLTVRHVAGDNPLRVVIDLKGRLPARQSVFAPEPPGALRLTAKGAAELPDVESIAIAEHDGHFDPAGVIAALAARGSRRILIEGGGATVSSFLTQGMLDRLHLVVAPFFIGGGRRGIALSPSASLDEAKRPISCHIGMGDDVLFDLDVKRLIPDA